VYTILHVEAATRWRLPAASAASPGFAAVLKPRAIAPPSVLPYPVLNSFGWAHRARKKEEVRMQRFLRMCAVALLACACEQVVGHAPTDEDGEALAQLVANVGTVHDLLTTNPPPKKRKTEGVLTADQRAKLLSLWAPHVDHDLALASYEERFLDTWRGAGAPEDQTRALALGVAALAARISSNLDFLEVGARSESAQVAMDESAPDYGLPPGQFRRILWETAKPHTQLKLSLGLQALQRRLEGFRNGNRSKDKTFVKVSDKGIEYAADVERRYASVAPRLMAQAMGQVTASGFDAVSSVLVTNIALWLGDTRLRGSQKSLISAEQVDWLATQAKPGDVLVERRNWYLSNLGLPGFWPHAAFYVGTPEELAASLDGEPAVVQAYGPGGLTAWLKQNAASAWSQYVGLAEDGRPHRILEAISDGVLFSSLHEATMADYVAVMRPRLSPLDKARAIAKAFGAIGKPYDFDFDFLTADQLVCSEVVYQAYLPDTGVQTGLTLPLTEVMGRQTLPPNDIVRTFDQQFGTDKQQLDFVAFLDGREATRNAVQATVDDLRKSWQRPKWDLSQQ
jgi:hypothetical protein